MNESELVTGPEPTPRKSSKLFLAFTGTIILVLVAFILAPTPTCTPTALEKLLGVPLPAKCERLCCIGCYERDIVWNVGETACKGTADCLQKAEADYTLALKYKADPDQTPKHKFTTFYHFSRAEQYLRQSGVKEQPPLFVGLDSDRSAVKGELETFFHQKRVEYHNAGKRKLYPKMVAILGEVTSVFYHPGAREHQWAMQMEHRLKDEGTFPGVVPKAVE